jgi:hypothetical protein
LPDRASGSAKSFFASFLRIYGEFLTILWSV